jgi:hypothetical protein
MVIGLADRSGYFLPDTFLYSLNNGITSSVNRDWEIERLGD